MLYWRVNNMSIKKLTSNDIVHVTGVTPQQHKNIFWHSHELKVNQILSFDEFRALIRNIAKDCSSPDGEVVFELIDFAIRVNILLSYAFVDLPNDPNTLYYVIYCSDLFDVVCRAINQRQLQSIYRTISLIVGGTIGVGGA